MTDRPKATYLIYHSNYENYYKFDIRSRSNYWNAWKPSIKPKYEVNIKMDYSVGLSIKTHIPAYSPG